MSGLLVAQVGNLNPDIQHTTEWDLRRSLEDLGHDVLPFNERNADFLTILNAVRHANADLLIWTRTPGHHTDKESETLMLKGLERARIPTVGIHLDRYWDLDREVDIANEPFFRCSMVATADGGNDDRWKKAGVNHHWFRPAVYVGSCDLPGVPSNRLTSDIAFVGSWRPYHPEWPYRNELLTFLTTTYRRRFRAWPRGRAIRGQELNDLYASVKVVVGDSIFADTAEKYSSDRPWECVGRGGFLIQPTMLGMNDFIDGEHLKFYTVGDFVELRHLIDTYLRPEFDAERTKIAKQGHAHVRATGTYAHRLREVLSVLEKEHSIRRIDQQ